MKKHTLRLTALCGALALAACGGENPERLAQRVEAALEGNDAEALVANADLAQAPAMLHFMLMDMPGDCGADVVCKVTFKPLDPEWEKERREMLAQQGVEMPAQLAGVLEVTGREAGKPETDKPQMTVSMPVAQVDGKYRIVAGRFTAAKLAELQATTAEAATEKMFAEGIYDQATQSKDTEWKSKATALPADGGDPGKAYLAEVSAVSAAVEANDPDAAAKALGDWGEAVLGATDYRGPVAMPDRQRKLKAQATRFVLEAKVLGGWQLGDTAVLVVEGRNGVGATVRGPLLMRLENGTWQRAGDDMVEIPAGA